MKSFLSGPIGIAVGITVPVLLFCWFISTREVSESELDSSDPLVPRSRHTSVGGIERPQSDLVQARLGQVSKLGMAAAANLKKGKDIQFTLGEVTCPKVPRLAKGQNPQMDSVIEAMESGKNPERLSPIHPPTEFDREAWWADPTVYVGVSKEPSTLNEKKKNSTRLVSFKSQQTRSYMNVSEPGRVFDVMSPGRGVKVLTSKMVLRQEINEGESVYLSVITEPFAPASFATFSVGKFSNGLFSITIAADKDGVAKASFTGTSGHETVDIVAGSPLTTGTVRFHVIVKPTHRR